MLPLTALQEDASQLLSTFAGSGMPGLGAVSLQSLLPLYQPFLCVISSSVSYKSTMSLALNPDQSIHEVLKNLLLIVTKKTFSSK